MATPTFRLALNFVGTQKSSPTNGLTFASSSTATGTWTSAPDIPTITTASRQYLPITVGTEIVWLYTHTTGSTSGKFLRGMEQTSKASHTKAPWGNNPTAWDGLLEGPSRYGHLVTAHFESILRNFVNTTTTPVTKKLYATAIFLPAGCTIGHIGYISSGAATTPTHWWFALTNATWGLLAVTADQTTTAWASSTWKALPIAKTAGGSATSFTTTYSGRHYVVVNQVATTPATLRGQAQQATVTGNVPILGQKLSGTHTGPPTFPTTFSTTNSIAQIPYCWVGP